MTQGRKSRSESGTPSRSLRRLKCRPKATARNCSLRSFEPSKEPCDSHPAWSNRVNHEPWNPWNPDLTHTWSLSGRIRSADGSRRDRRNPFHEVRYAGREHAGTPPNAWRHLPGRRDLAATFASITRSIPWAHLDRVCSGPPVSCSRAPRHTSLPTFRVPCTTSRWLPSRRRARRRSRRGSMPIAGSASTARGGRLASCDRSRCPRALGARARGRRCLGARVAAGREACLLRRTRTLARAPGPLGAEPASPLDRPELHRGRNRRRAHP